ncbi:MAG TPA: hypothetical protein VGI33_04965 [Paenibacillus sp.]
MMNVASHVRHNSVRMQTGRRPADGNTSAGLLLIYMQLRYTSDYHSV